VAKGKTMEKTIQFLNTKYSKVCLNDLVIPFEICHFYAILAKKGMIQQWGNLN
jgi:hypothetical protein